ncbi:MAG: glycosyltransferase, partial [Chitinophagales bacterium]
LFFGFIRNYKGLDLAIQAMADTRLRVLPLKLIVAGEFYEDARPYHELISRLSLSQRVVLRTDFISDEEVRKYFSAADLLVQPYKSSTQSGVTQIAFQFNKPVIVTKTGGLPEFVLDSKSGFCVDTNPEAIAEAILKFYRDDLGETMELFIEKEKKKYSWKAFADTVMNLMQSIPEPTRLANS